MGSIETYLRQTIDNPNPITRFAHRRRHAISLRMVCRLAPCGGRLVDFGAGPGLLLAQLAQERPDLELFAVEPYKSIAYPGARKVRSLQSLQSLDVVCAFEVLEHLNESDLQNFLATTRRLLNPGGYLVVTVPIMLGPVLPIKELARAVTIGRPTNLSLRELTRATVGLPIAHRVGTHDGFDFRALQHRIADKFTLCERSFSPFPRLPWWLNSQAIFIAS